MYELNCGRNSLFSGGVAGTIASCITNPLEVIKTQLQSSNTASGDLALGRGHPVTVAKRIMEADGVAGFWRGLPPTLVGIIPSRSAYFYAVDEIDAVGFSDEQLEKRDTIFLERVEALNPIPNYFGDSLKDIIGSQYPIQRIVEKFGSFTQGSSYMYDAIMSIGLGACKAAMAIDRSQNNTAITGKMHLDGIRSVDFHGASGRVAFGGEMRAPGSRVADTIPFAVVNLLPEKGSG